MDKKRPADKAKNLNVTAEFLATRAERSIAAGFSKQKWIEFCEVMLERRYTLTIYEAKKTFSKYITIKSPNGGKRFKVRFSNHKPIKRLEVGGACDFFVGWTHTGIRTTAEAIEAVDHHFNLARSGASQRKEN